jgi:hypothetical protein
MTRAALLVLLLGGCGDSVGDVIDAGADAAADLAAVSCPATPPVGLCAGFSQVECDYPGQICKCDDQWYCRSSTCPSAAVAGGSCTQPGQLCDYGFEQAVVCVGPENRWVFCGGVPLCESQTTGALCCGSSNGSCGPTCVCGSDDHVICGGDGGA